MVSSIDHIVIAVHDLSQASADYAALGFTVTPGGEHTGGASHNALISFTDGAYVELIAFRDPASSVVHRWASFLENGEGTVAFALLSGDLVTESARLTAAGLAASPIDGGRERPDGQRIAWKSTSFAAGDVPLPFLIEDITPRNLRVPDGGAMTHPLGVTGVAGVVIAVPDLAAASDAYARLLETPGEVVNSASDGAEAAVRFSLGSHWIELAQPDTADSALRRHLNDRAPGPFEIILNGGANPNDDILPLTNAHGARIRLER